MKIIFVQLKQLKQLKSKRDTKSRGSLFIFTAGPPYFAHCDF